MDACVCMCVSVCICIHPSWALHRGIHIRIGIRKIYRRVLKYIHIGNMDMHSCITNHKHVYHKQVFLHFFVSHFSRVHGAQPHLLRFGLLFLTWSPKDLYAIWSALNTVKNSRGCGVPFRRELGFSKTKTLQGLERFAVYPIRELGNESLCKTTESWTMCIRFYRNCENTNGSNPGEGAEGGGQGSFGDISS